MELSMMLCDSNDTMLVWYETYALPAAPTAPRWCWLTTKSNASGCFLFLVAVFFFLRRQKFNTLPLCFVFFLCVNQYNRNACHLFLHPSVALCCFYTFFIYPVLEFVFRVFVVCMTTSTHRRAFNWWHHADLYDTTLVWYGLACSEKPSPDENGSKSWNPPEHKVNAAHSTGTLERDFYDVLRFHQHHTHLIWTHLFREALSRRKGVKIMELASTQSKRGIFNWDPW